MSLADHFFQDGDYYRAITEYKRFLFFFPQSSQNPAVMMKIGRAYYLGKRWDEAISACDALLKKFPQSSLQSEAFLLKGLAFFEKKDFPQARFFFEKAQEDSANRIIFNEAQKQIGLSYLREEEWKKAAKEFRKIQEDSPLFPKGKSIADGLDRIGEVPQKSPYGAGILAAVLPGAGHVYCERYQDAAAAFLLNAVFIWGMVEAFRQEEYVIGGILTFFEIGWYSGNIYSAVNGAHKFNARKKQEYLEFLENVSFGASFQRKNHIFSLRYVF
jgi:tetratricopeptide (TPR) repeat protein